jgi:outer membrane murein-binding lipoprotein Lpp
MKPVIRKAILLLLAALSLSLSITGCSSTPEPQVTQDDQGNSADSQRSNAKQAQDELTRETSGEK